MEDTIIGRTEFYSDAHVVVEIMNMQGTGGVGVIGDSELHVVMVSAV
jgi:hypothetical protein